MYEDDTDGFGFKTGKYLLTTYEAQQLPSENGLNDGGEVLVRVARSEGDWARPDRKLQVRLLVGHTTQVLGQTIKTFEDLRNLEC